MGKERELWDRQPPLLIEELREKTIPVSLLGDGDTIDGSVRSIVMTGNSNDLGGTITLRGFDGPRLDFRQKYWMVVRTQPKSLGWDALGACTLLTAEVYPDVSDLTFAYAGACTGPKSP